MHLSRRRRATVTLAASAVIAAALGACTAARHSVSAAAPVAPAVQLAVLGDSLAFGTGAGDSSGGFAFRIYRSLALARPGSEITNTAIGGSTAADVLRLQTGRLHERRFDLVLLCVGGNDVVRGTPTAVFAREYRGLLSVIRRTAPAAALVAVGVPDVSISPLFADHAVAVRRLAQADDEAARTAANAAGAAYVDLFNFTRRVRDPAVFLSADRFHPSDSGHAQIAAQALPVVEAELARRMPVTLRKPG